MILLISYLTASRLKRVDFLLILLNNDFIATGPQQFHYRHDINIDIHIKINIDINIDINGNTNTNNPCGFSEREKATGL